MKAPLNRSQPDENPERGLVVHETAAIRLPYPHLPVWNDLFFESVGLLERLDENPRTNLWEMSVFFAAVLFSQRGKAVSIRESENFYFYFRLSSESEKLNYPLTSPRFSFSRIDAKLNIAVKEVLSRTTATHDSLEDEFYLLAKQWKEETAFHSSLTKIYAHPAYQRIMAMGTDGIPFVLKELQKNQGHWFYALKFMAGKNISEGMNIFEDAKAAWLEWGYNNNYI